MGEEILTGANSVLMERPTNTEGIFMDTQVQPCNGARAAVSEVGGPVLEMDCVKGNHAL